MGPSGGTWCVSNRLTFLFGWFVCSSGTCGLVASESAFLPCAAELCRFVPLLSKKESFLRPRPSPHVTHTCLIVSLPHGENKQHPRLPSSPRSGKRRVSCLDSRERGSRPRPLCSLRCYLEDLGHVTELLDASGSPATRRERSHLTRPKRGHAQDGRSGR